MNSPALIFALVVIYLIAAIPTGVVLARLMGGGDVRRKGSGNIGATNVYRVAGKLAGVLTLLGDVLKGLLPLLVLNRLFGATESQLASAGLVAIIGHCYPVYLRFRGGKGVATALGILLVLSPKAVLGALVVFLLAVGISRFVSLGSVLAALSAPLLVLMLGHTRPIFLATLAIALLVVWRHRSNIRRLLEGSESRFRA
jgi:glycerol-3-phosphate acyltransferase PlsY